LTNTRQTKPTNQPTTKQTTKTQKNPYKQRKIYKHTTSKRQFMAQKTQKTKHTQQKTLIL
jgi:hypothetical protein